MHPKDTIPYGYCHCGCGQKTRLAPKTRAKYGWVKGEPLRFIHNHHKGRWQDHRYDVVDCGYETPCWVWRLSYNENGYGKVRVNGRGHNAHRVMYEERYGKVPDDLVLDHLCRNRACVNPDHLEPVSFAENMRRGASARLTHQQVEEIRHLKGKESGTLVARRFGVSNSAIYAIWRGESWQS